MNRIRTEKYKRKSRRFLFPSQFKLIFASKFLPKALISPPLFFLSHSLLPPPPPLQSNASPCLNTVRFAPLLHYLWLFLFFFPFFWLFSIFFLLNWTKPRYYGSRDFLTNEIACFNVLEISANLFSTFPNSFNFLYAFIFWKSFFFFLFFDPSNCCPISLSSSLSPLHSELTKLFFWVVFFFVGHLRIQPKKKMWLTANRNRA